MIYPDNSTERTCCMDCQDRSCIVAVLNESQLKLLNENSHEQDIKKGDVILRSGALASHIIYLKSGYAKEFVVTQDKKERILQIVKHHSYLGLQSLFGNKINQYSYTALEDLKICHIDITVFLKFIKEEGGFAYEVLNYICRETLGSFSHYINLSNKRLNGRFADILIYFSEKIYDSPKYYLPLNRQELADMIGVSRENTTRTLSRFRKDGIVNISGREVEILKPDLLRKISKNG